jgi:transcriptional regulator with XRE-family HTH domain
MELAKNILRLCEEKGITVTHLARLARISQPTLHGWTTGRSVKKIEDLKKVCEIFKVSLHYILFNIPDPHEKLDQSSILEEIFNGEVSIKIRRTKK